AVSFNGLGELHRLTGRLAEAEATLREAVALLQKLVAEAPDDRQQREDLARSYLQLAALMQAVGRPPEAAELRQRATKIRQSIDGGAKYQGPQPPGFRGGGPRPRRVAGPPAAARRVAASGRGTRPGRAPRPPAARSQAGP